MAYWHMGVFAGWDHTNKILNFLLFDDGFVSFLSSSVYLLIAHDRAVRPCHANQSKLLAFAPSNGRERERECVYVCI